MTEIYLDTGDAKPIYHRPNRAAWKEKEEIEKQVQEMLRQGIIEPSKSSWSSRVVLARKPDKSWRFCADYRAINAVTKKDVYPLPNVVEALSSLEGSRWFSNVDLQAGFHQLPLTKDSKEKTAFITTNGLYQFKVLPFGVVTAPAHFQRTMDLILAGLGWLICLVYLDDVIIHAPTLDLHLDRLALVLERLQNAGLTIKLSKCHFAERRLRCLGHIVSEAGIAVDPEKIKAITELQPPTPEMKPAAKLKLVQSYVGFINYYRRHVDNFAMLARPLTQLSVKNAPFVWGPLQQESFDELKKAMLNAATLAHPRYDMPMEL